MVLLFLPSMRVLAPVFMGTSVLVGGYEGAGAPVGALLLAVAVKLGFTAKVLPVVSIYTQISLMFSFIIRTPH